MKPNLASNALFSSLHVYEGEGSIYIDTFEPIPCRFTFVQEQDGANRLTCEMDRDVTREIIRRSKDLFDERIFGNVDLEKRFQGQTADGLALETASISVSSRSWQGNFLRVDFICPTATLTASDTSGEPCLIRVPVVNLFFSPVVYEHRFPNGLTVNGQQLPLNLGEHHLTICYRETAPSIDEIKRRRGIAVNCDIIAPVDSFKSDEEMEKVLHTLCSLLTFVNGTRTTWIGYDVCSADGKMLRRACESMATARYEEGQWTPWPWMGDQKEFFESAYDRYNQLSNDWDIYAVINLFVALQREEDFLEIAALQLASCVEMLNARYLSRNNKVELLPENDFIEVKKKLEKQLKQIMKVVDEGISSAAAKDRRKLLYSNLSGLNHYPFAKALCEICHELNFEVEEPAVKRFKNNRNKLVHTGLFDVFKNKEFIPEKASPSEQWSEYGTKTEERMQEFSFMLDFVGTLILCALGGKKKLDEYQEYTIEGGESAAFEIKIVKNPFPESSD